MFSPKVDKSIELQQAKDCQICSSEIPTFVTIINHSLFGKYSSSQNFYYTKDVEEILGEEMCHNFVQFQENNYIDDDEQYLKRQYALDQFPKKIDMLSQYYKFHRNQPTWNDRGVEPIMVRHYNKVKDVDYKKIKSVLKREQNISITTHNSFSSFDNSEVTKKSRYSSMLNQLNTQQNQSMLLMEICDKIGKALKKVKPEQFKGNYYSGEKKFEDYLKKQKKAKEIAKKKQQTQKQAFGLKKFKFNQKLNTKNDDNGLKQFNFGSNHSIHNRNLQKYKQLSIERTTANQTTSREERSRREKSNKNLALKSSRASLSKKSFKDHYNTDITPPNYRQLSTLNLGAITNANNLKTINEIYQTGGSKHQFVDLKKNQRPSSSRLKYRSNSTHNLQTQKPGMLGHQNVLLQSKKQINLDNKMMRTNSKKKLPTSTAKISNINLLEPAISTERNEPKLKNRQSSHRIIRTNSTGKLLSTQKMHSNENIERCKPNGFQNKKKFTNNIQKNDRKTQSNKNKKFGSQRNSVIENMLEKKLQLVKKKQVIS